MRNAARFIGILWMAGVAMTAIVLIGSGTLRGNRGDIYLLFGAGFPGLLLFRLGEQIRSKEKRPATKSIDPKGTHRARR
jgi:hypothetical protein